MSQQHQDILTSDADLAKRVAIYLTNNRNDLGALMVTSHLGAIRLTGTVPTFYLRQLAVACAQRVSGVRTVVDDVHVDYHRGHPALTYHTSHGKSLPSAQS
jgi:osmotically-inducible protein OsmY